MGSRRSDGRDTRSSTDGDLSRRERLILLTVALVGPIVAWYAAVALTRLPRVILPPPHEVVEALLTRSPFLLSQGAITLQEIVFGLAAGVALGVVGAVALVWFPLLERAVTPWIVFFYSVPKIVVAPLFAVWFGTGIAAQVLIVILVVFFPTLVMFTTGLKSLEAEMLDLVRSMGATRWQILRTAQAPAALPFFFMGLKVSATYATIGAVVSEWVAGDAGLGDLLLKAQFNSQTALLFADMFVLVGLGLTLYYGTVLAERAALPWHPVARRPAQRIG